MLNKLKIWLQFCVPQHGLSRLVGLLMESRITWIKNTIISILMRRFDIDLSDADRQSISEYETFNDFFTRSLRPDARPLDENVIVCPADGEISQLGEISSGTIIQAKGKDFDVASLLGAKKPEITDFENGKFITIYLSPRDYHRVHMPISGTLKKMIHIPGALFSVNQLTTNSVNHLFARNERVVSIFDTAIGPVAIIMVGAMIVGSIETTWAGQVTPAMNKSNNKSVSAGKNARSVSQQVTLQQGEEMGRFKMGSTVIVLLPGKADTKWKHSLIPGLKVRLGQGLCV